METTLDMEFEPFEAEYIGRDTAFLANGQRGTAWETERPLEIDFKPNGTEKIYRLAANDVLKVTPLEQE